MASSLSPPNPQSRGSTTQEQSSNKRAFPVKFVWDHGGKDVSVRITSLNGDSRTIAMAQTSAGYHQVNVKLCAGRFEYR